MRFSAPSLVLLVALLLCAPALSARAGDKIWSALILATNDKKSAVPEVIEPYARKMEKVFGYNNFEIVGQQTRDIDSEIEQWLLPSKRFYLSVDSRRAEGGYKLDLTLYRENKVLVETKARVGVGSPLFIRGPLYGDGQLIIVIAVQ